MATHVRKVTVRLADGSAKTYTYFRPNARQRLLGARMLPLDPSRAVEQAAELKASIPSPVEAEFRRHLMEIYRKSRKRAEERGLTFAITIDDAMACFAKTGGRCAVSGVSLNLVPKARGYRAPFRPSIDRIDARRGYERDNIRIVCLAVNAAPSDWGDDVFWTVVEHAARRRSRNKNSLAL